MIRLLHLACNVPVPVLWVQNVLVPCTSSMGTKKTQLKHFVGKLCTFHRRETKITYYTISRKLSPGGFSSIHVSIV